MLNKLEPKILWKYFEAICKIPRPSKNEQHIIRYIQETAQKLNLPVQIDPVGNVLVKKKASSHKKNSPIVILQSHLDMVQQKNSGIHHDFQQDPIRAYVDGEWVKAKDTTLGADNGIGVAAMMAILESPDLEHGPIEALFTVDEETGMTGAFNISPDLLKGKLLINLDSENDNDLYIGCAGGINATAQLTSICQKAETSHNSYQISIKGLRGGHSGVDIHLGRANAIKLLNRVLFELIQKFDIRISSFHGGSARNAIPREAFANISIPHIYLSRLKEYIPVIQEVLHQEYLTTDPELILEIQEIPPEQFVLTSPAQENLIRAIYACPNGIIRMNNQFPGIVETSNNLSMLECANEKSIIHCLLRSSSDSARDDLANAVLCALSLAEAHVEFSGAYPGWQPNPDSNLLKTLKSTYEQLFKQNANIRVIHAGLECGIIGAKYPQIDMVSLGPDILHPHSPHEAVNIKSVQKFWSFLCTALKNL
ncbi:MAG TPA: aminoacyl-histidine dipeptidase [Chitinispirillaceae bacterium]|nr:aminoacyl-histidine dipeptidase [Chitinispirillaceae bacterium]